MLSSVPEVPDLVSGDEEQNLPPRKSCAVLFRII
jgi:hypothetical protein